MESAASGRWLDMLRAGNELIEFEQLVRDPDWREIVPLVESLGRDPSRDIPRLAQFARLVLGWNRSVSNLISRADEDRLVSRHLRESIEPAPVLVETGVSDWIDFGSGAGFPALPLAIVGIGSEWNLVESRRPKALFMRRALQELALGGVQVTHARLEEVIAGEALEGEDGAPPPPLRRYGGLTSRATLRLGPTLDLAALIVRPGGYAILWKGSRRSEELAERGTWSEKWEMVGETHLAHGEVAVCSFLLKL